ncbi:hypothetical protein ACF0H5_001803 [Mactra antiquata]
MSSAVWWHGGNADPMCTLHGLHLHIVAAVPNLQQHRTFRNLKSSLNLVKSQVKCQIFRHRQGILRYLLNPPRVLLGTSNLQLQHVIQTENNKIEQGDVDETDQLTYDDWLEEASTTRTDQPFLNALAAKLSQGPTTKTVVTGKTFDESMKPPNSGPKIRTTKTVDKVQKYIDRMEKYKTVDVNVLKMKIMAANDDHDYKMLLDICLGYNSRGIRAHAMETYRLIKNWLAIPTLTVSITMTETTITL